MRVAHVITESSPFGGAQRNTLVSMEGLRRQGGTPVLVCGEGGELARRAREIGSEVHELADLVRTTAPLRDVRCFARLLALFLRGSFDVVHTHSTKAGLLGRLAARAAGVPIVVHTVHGFPFPLDGSRRARLYVAVERFAARASDASICVGETLRREVAGWKLPGRVRLVTIPSGIEFTALRPRRPAAETKAALGLEGAWPIVGSVGHLRPAKAQHHLLEAVASLRDRFPRIALVLVGEGELRSALEARIEELGLGAAARLLGERDDVADLLSVFDVFAMSSAWEGVGRALTEAMLRGLPVAVTAVNGVVDLVRDGETGLAVPPGNPAALAAAIERLVADPELAARLGRAARERVERTMSAEAMVEAIGRLYDELRPGALPGKVHERCAASPES